ncbi:L-threonine 3-dehydrogenase [Xanthomonas arboricola pv. corylina]|uniref:L-threonine 3-dehydrogenase n=1 Tax=Xanthomonas arboricola pv. corylina TaxID=487821 RepID=A0ABN7M0Y7_9XANT|nr:NADP-dependent oxidoreductase [Xanthomonas arboricola]WIX25319.1 NADP-dependent oxidoreductase [Xanthomonas arboricola pv. corylina]CAE6779431.1 L-threonine 3-dehydrogenase [Xanthomonas arboricola pv. corylina]CAE6779445.1 L-threonine 3-dehydrogenase [Xanthomonas arboricola pv. corylina]CAE6779683.1 L-threonine 3-dehydrogenase [Xanthomonas arboricola pv. corylina]CAE6779695.1 L-threonine 3-dehydrogenase [Xanthomonas arboricola pv. corylina]
MKAVRLKSYGDIDEFVVDEIPMPSPQAGEILIKIEASAVNHVDLLIRQGYVAQFIPLELPAVLGTDAAGTVVETGIGVTGIEVGDRVIADFAHNGKGAHAEYGVVAIAAVAKLPVGLTFEQGATLPKAGLAGRQSVNALHLKAGDRVLISGALGAVGRAPIQYLREIGANPIAGVRTSRLEEARQLAGEALDITETPSSAEFDYAISAAAPVAGNLIRHVRNGGHITSIVPVPEGANADHRVRIDELYHRTDAEMLQAVVEVASRGELIIPIGRTFPLDQVGAAQSAVAAGVQGKVVLKH